LRPAVPDLLGIGRLGVLVLGTAIGLVVALLVVFGLTVLLIIF
jgi:hypothetical protein